VYENKQISDNVPGKKSDIYVLDSDISYKRTRILQKSPAYLSVLEARDEFLASACSNSGHGHPVRERDMAGWLLATGRSDKLPVPRDVADIKRLSNYDTNHQKIDVIEAK
jgi:hypothetical protein